MKAVSLLRDPDVKIISVAEQCGFNHLGLFNVCFKKRFGQTPGQWRKGAPDAGKQESSLEAGPACSMRSLGLCPWTPKKAAGAPMAQEGTPMKKNRS